MLITNESELEVGSFYWVRLKFRAGTNPIVIQCKQGKFLDNKNSSQAFKLWDIQGPILSPSELSWTLMYRVWSYEHNAWWAPNYRGYTPDINKAGVYTHDQAVRICKDANYGGKINEEMRLCQ